MGQATLKRRIVKHDLIDSLNNCQSLFLEYPTEEYSGIYECDRLFLSKIFLEWKHQNRSQIKLKLKCIDRWIYTCDRLTKNGDIVNLETKMISINLPTDFRNNLRELIDDELGYKDNGNTVYIAMTSYLMARLAQNKIATEATISQAIYCPLSNSFTPGFPLLIDGEPLLKKDKLSLDDDVLSGAKWVLLQSYFKESDYHF
jgi:hypothetical protein